MAALQIIWGVWCDVRTGARGTFCGDMGEVKVGYERELLAEQMTMINPDFALVYGPCSREEAEEYVRDME